MSGNDCFDVNGVVEFFIYFEIIGKLFVILDLSGCFLGDNGLIWLCEAFRGLKTLRRFEIFCFGLNGIGDLVMLVLVNFF